MGDNRIGMIQQMERRVIVSEDTISKALQYLSIDPHPYALAKKYVVDAENKRKQAYASAFVDAEGSVEARRAAAELDGDYHIAQEEEAEAVLDLERHKARARAAEMLIEVWRSENANVRAAERVR